MDLILDNRMSCEIPTNFIIDHTNLSKHEELVEITDEIHNLSYSRLILPSNLFQCKSSNIPSWLSSPFITAENLYITQFERYESNFIIVFGLVCLILLLTKMFIKYIKIGLNRIHKLSSQSSIRRNSISFIENVGEIVGKFGM